MPQVLDLIDEVADDGAEILMLEPRDEYDKCLVGLGERFTSVFAVYDRRCILDVIAAGMPDEPDAEAMAVEHYEFNILGGWVGDGTPAFINIPD